MNPAYSLKGTSLAHKFEGAKLFSHLDLSLESGQSLAITGPNGSGKSTLMQILCGLRRPSSGRITVLYQTKPVAEQDYYRHMGVTGPLVNPYLDLTAMENLDFAAQEKLETRYGHELLNSFGLYPHRNKKVRHYSTGMIQRLKYILCVMSKPGILFLDEPGSNLDEAGKRLTFEHIKSFRKDAILVIATNDAAEAALCEKELALGQ